MERKSNGEGQKGEQAEEGTAALIVSMSGRQRRHGMRCLLSLGSLKPPLHSFMD